MNAATLDVYNSTFAIVTKTFTTETYDKIETEKTTGNVKNGNGIDSKQKQFFKKTEKN